ncbi:MAG: caspase family protein [Candidatus Cloacimonetes bacterium]|nr:caspase family protein [Candidatus Cloacimonadota bacterium]
MKCFGFCLIYLFFVSCNFSLSLVSMNSSFEDKKHLDNNVTPSLYAKDYALLIGNYQYNTDGRHDRWTNLKSVKEDIEAVADYLKTIGFLVTIKWNRTGKQLREDYKSFGEAHSDNLDNRLLYYYAGHGTTISPLYGGDPQSYLVGVTAPKSNTKFNRKLLKTRSLSMDTFLPLAKAIDTKHALFVFDSCFSGNIFVQARGDNQNHIIDKLRHPVRYFITSGDEGELVDDSGDFRKIFLEGIQSKADLYKDGYITASELGLYIQNEMGQFKNYQHPQHGPIKIRELSKGEFIFQTNPAKEPGMISSIESNSNQEPETDKEVESNDHDSEPTSESKSNNEPTQRQSIFDKIQFSFSFDDSSSSSTSSQNVVQNPQVPSNVVHQNPISPVEPQQANPLGQTAFTAPQAPPITNASPTQGYSANSNNNFISQNAKHSKTDFNQQFKNYHNSSSNNSRSQRSFSNVGPSNGSPPIHSRSSRSSSSTRYKMPAFKANNGFKMNLREMNPSRSRGGFQLMGSDGQRGNDSTNRGRPSHGFGGGGASGGGGQRGFHGGGGGRGHGGGGRRR